MKRSMRLVRLSSVAFVLMIFGSYPAQAASYGDDRAEIENLMSAYLHAFDTLDAKALTETFVPGGEIVLTGDGFPTARFEGVEGIKTFVAAVRSRNNLPPTTSIPAYSPNIHFFSNLVLRVDGDQAFGSSYWFTVRRGANVDIVGQLNPNPSTFVSVGSYEDQFVRIGGHWLIKRRTIGEMHPAMAGKPESSGK